MIVPYTPEWYEARRGKITASQRLYMAVWGTPREKNELLDELELELATRAIITPPNKYQAWGRNHEEQAIALIEMQRDVDTDSPGLIGHPDVPILAATPDFGVLEIGAGGASWGIMGEVKCPYYLKWHYATFRGLRNLRFHQVGYYTQMQGQMLIAGAREGWFASFHPNAPPGKQLYFERVAPDHTLHKAMLSSCAELANMLERRVRFGIGQQLNADGVPQIF